MAERMSFIQRGKKQAKIFFVNLGSVFLYIFCFITLFVLFEVVDDPETSQWISLILGLEVFVLVICQSECKKELLCAFCVGIINLVILFLAGACGR